MDVFASIAEKILGPSKKPENASDQSTDEIKLAAYVKSKVEEVRQNGSRVAHEGIWMTNIAYVLGFDSVFYDTTSRQYKVVGQPNRYLKRSRLHVNKILPAVQNRLARLLKSPPKFDIMPESNSQEDKDAARLGLDVLKMLWDKQKINVKRINLMMWVQQCGYAFLKVCWDDQLGKPMMSPDEAGGDAEFAGYEGDVRVDVVSPFEVFVDPLAKSMEEVQWLVHAKVRKLDYFKSHYPERGSLVKEEGAWLLSSQYEMRINSLNNQGPTSSGVEQQMKNAAIEMVYYEKRSKKHPNGRQVTIANGIVLDDNDLPIGEIPFAKFDDVVVAGKFMSESIVTHLRPIQDQYNRLITKRAEWTNKLLNGKFIAPKGHGMIAEALNDQSGEVLEYNPVPNGSPPSAMSIPVIPQYAYTEEDKLNQMFNDISGMQDIDKGTLPSAGIPAIGMQFLEEMSSTRLGIETEQHEHAWAQVGQFILKHVSSCYEMPRLLKQVNGSEHVVKEFVGSDLRNNHDIYVIRGSTVPTSKALRRQEILNMYDRGLLGDPKDPKTTDKLLDVLEFGDIGGVWEDLSIDMAQIKQSIAMIESEQVPEREELDNHELHIQEKNKYRKSDKFRNLSPNAKLILRNDIEWHIQQIMKIANPGLEGQFQMANSMHQAADQAQNQMGLQALPQQGVM